MTLGDSEDGKWSSNCCAELRLPSFTLVDCRPYFSLWICPRAVYVDFGKCLLISFVVNPGYEEKLFFAIAVVKVDTVGDKQVVWRYYANSFLVCFCFIMTLALQLIRDLADFIVAIPGAEC